ncbi:MAG TPA: ATP-binding protein [Polyangiaceae bacterium]|nr:ATP-binding protein [Polyangiaceae bacterium]
MPFTRALVDELATALRRKPALLQVIVGPRQVGKTTAAEQLAERLGWPTVFAAADAPLPPGPEWVEAQWRLARLKKPGAGGKVLLVLDEVQKVVGWSESVKRLWDEERRTKGPVLAVLLGSSALLVHQGASESLAGRFFLHRCQHWSWDECRRAFGWDLDRWLFFGGYPGAAALAADEATWKRYVTDALIDVALSRDVLALQTVTKPALLRHLFALAAAYPAQILSYNKMLGQLQNAGNVTTLAGYLRLLETAFLASGLELFSQGQVRKRGSSPKLILWNNALITALSLRSRRETLADGGLYGRLVENAVGAHLLCGLPSTEFAVTYWRDGHEEVDFVVTHGKRIWAIEVKSGRPGRLSGLAAFRRRYPKAQALLFGGEGVPLTELFGRPAVDWFA